MNDPVLTQALEDLIKTHGCHSIILYGSHARGDATPESDYDLIGIRELGEKIWDARLIQGRYLDAFIYAEKDVIDREEEFLRIRNGKVLVEADGFATRLLTRVEAIYQRGPKPLPEDEQRATRVWIRKMLARIEAGGIEGDFRRAQLQHDLLESYFKLRRRWYLGPKESFRWLSANEPAVYARFERALARDGAQRDHEALAELVLG